MIRVKTESNAIVRVRTAGSHLAVVDLSGHGTKPRSGCLCVCMDCGQTWDEGASSPDFPPTCAKPQPHGPPVARTDYLIRIQPFRRPGDMPLRPRYWTGDGWADEAVNAVRFADWKSANNLLTNVLQPFVFPGVRAEIVPEIVT